MITSLVYNHQRFEHEIQFEQISEVIKNPKNLVWVDVEQPTEEDMKSLTNEFPFHVLSIEDALHGNQRPKLEEYEGYFFIVAHWLKYDAEQMELEILEVDFFIGRNYVVTVHKEQCKALDDAAARVRQHPRILEEGLGLLVYTLLDTIIDDYMPILDQIDDQVDGIEESIFEHCEPTAINGIFKLKRELLRVRRNVGHMRDVFNILARRDQPLFSAQTVLYFQDIYDHLYRITDAVDIYRDVLTGALEAYISLNANKLNEIMKVFAGISIMLMTAALIAGIYGMNFVHLPETKWEYGYPSALLLMGALAAAEFWWFRRKRWL